MTLAWLEAHFHAMELARAAGAVRTVQGHAYPVREAELAAWMSAQHVLRQTRVRNFLRTSFARRRAAQAALA